MSLEGALKAIKSLYGECPAAECQTCTRCGVAPHMGFVEFANLFERLVESFSPDRLIALVKDAPVESERYPGSFRCELFSDGVCGAAAGRGLSCRVRGLEEVDELFGPGDPLCKSAHEGPCSTVAANGEAEKLLDRVNKLDTEFYPVLGAPYCIDGLNLKSWIAVLLDEGITQKPFIDMREQLWARHDISYLKEHYVNHTRMKQKIDMIDMLYDAMDRGMYKQASMFVKRLQSEFPHTGTYFYYQLLVYEQELQEIVMDLGYD